MFALRVNVVRLQMFCTWTIIMFNLKTLAVSAIINKSCDGMQFATLLFQIVQIRVIWARFIAIQVFIKLDPRSLYAEILQYNAQSEYIYDFNIYLRLEMQLTEGNIWGTIFPPQSFNRQDSFRYLLPTLAEIYPRCFNFWV